MRLMSAKSEQISRCVRYLFLTVVLWLFLLSPYFNFGVVVNGGILGVGFALLLRPASVSELARQPWLYHYLLLFVSLGAYAGFMTSLYGGGDLSFMKVMISLVVYMAVGFLVGRFLVTRGYTTTSALSLLLKIALVVIVLNSAIVVASFFAPSFKLAIESVLAAASNIDYKTHGFRLRGLASAGGASLAAMHAIGIWIALALHRRKDISVVSLVLSSSLILVAMLFIGRTGFVIVALALLIYVVATTSIAALSRVFLAAAVLGATIYFGWTFVSDLIPPGVQQYSLLFFFDGTEGLKQEGTLDTLSQELFLPDNLNHLLFGIGYYNGENILRQATDPGYMKSLLSLGLPLAVLLYASLLRFLWPLLRSRDGRILVLPIVLLLLFAEIKEPFFYSGYAARLLFLLGGAWVALESLREAGSRRSGSTRDIHDQMKSASVRYVGLHGMESR